LSKECVSKRIFKIGQYLEKKWTMTKWKLFGAQYTRRMYLSGFGKVLCHVDICVVVYGDYYDDD